MGADRSLQKAKEVGVGSIDLTNRTGQDGKGGNEMEFLEFKRLQFRRATANNPSGGNDPDYHILTANLYALVPSESKSSSSRKLERIKIGSFTSQRIVVRGRSPKDFEKNDGKSKRGGQLEVARTPKGRGLGRKRKASSTATVEDESDYEPEEEKEVVSKRTRCR